ncbi:MAG: DUF3536 domain-containing protein [Elusimicrobia bacterium]|nr:DUF3536 domain-containing protein [Elusimicrobiota bacterium]
MNKKFFCVHGHFYQPPRENPWLGVIEAEPSAAPESNWNRRILNECYGPNCAAGRRPAGAAAALLNNYSLMSFDFGPTLLDWLEKHALAVYLSVLEADKLSVKAFGRGNAMAQVYNHVIMPLASARDKKTQILWGAEHFTHNFKRKTEGMWLAETAADEETLEALCSAGIAFTVLKASQARAWRPLGADKWDPAAEEGFDTSRPYRWFSKIQPGKYLDIFFYHPGLARRLKREIKDPEKFYGTILSKFCADRVPQLISAASDGENYGHHVKNGAGGLAALFRKIKKENDFMLTNYAAFLAERQPAHEVGIVSPSAWSCPHGVGRWSADCGCRHSAIAKSQDWRRVLRRTLDDTASLLDALYEREASDFFEDPWRARNDYIAARKNREHATAIRRFLTLAASKHLEPRQARKALNLLEMQRNRMLMFTSCGWFFDDLTNIETVQILKYAARAVETAALYGVNAEALLAEGLKEAEANYGGLNGAQIYERFVKPLAVDMTRAAANFAMTSAAGARPPFLSHSRWRFKTLQASDLELDGRPAIFMRVTAETDDTLEQCDYAVFVLKKPFLKCALKPWGEAAPAAPDSFAPLAAQGFEVFDAHTLYPDARRTAEILIRRDKEDPLDAAYLNWLMLIKNFTPRDISGGKVLSALQDLAKYSVAPDKTPFLDDILDEVSARFGFLLETGSPEIAAMLPWIEHLASGPLRNRLWQFRLAAYNRTLEGRTGGDKGFEQSFREICLKLEVEQRLKIKK